MPEEPTNYKKTITIIILILVFVALIAIFQKWRLVEPIRDTILTAEKDSLTIFIPTRYWKLEKKTFEIKKGISGKEKTELILTELKKENAIPDKLTIYDFTTDNEGIIYLNLSKDIVDEKIHTSREITMTYAIVNSLIFNFKNTKKVQFLVEGNPVYTFNGVLYTYIPLEFNKELLED